MADIEKLSTTIDSYEHWIGAFSWIVAIAGILLLVLQSKQNSLQKQLDNIEAAKAADMRKGYEAEIATLKAKTATEFREPSPQLKDKIRSRFVKLKADFPDTLIIVRIEGDKPSARRILKTLEELAPPNTIRDWGISLVGTTDSSSITYSSNAPKPFVDQALVTLSEYFAHDLTRITISRNEIPIHQVVIRINSVPLFMDDGKVKLQGVD